MDWFTEKVITLENESLRFWRFIAYVLLLIGSIVGMFSGAGIIYGLFMIVFGFILFSFIFKVIDFIMSMFT